MPRNTSKTCIEIMGEALKPIRARLDQYGPEAMREYLAFMVANDLLNNPPWAMLDSIQACADTRDYGRQMDQYRVLAGRLVGIGLVSVLDDGYELRREPTAQEADLWDELMRLERSIDRLGNRLVRSRAKLEAVVASPEDSTRRAYADRAGKAGSPFETASRGPSNPACEVIAVEA